MTRPSTTLKGRTAVITGGTRGIGLIIAASLAQAGAQIALCGRTIQSAESVYAQFSAIPMVEVLALAADVRDPAQLTMLAEQTIARFGKIDIWVNNAGITGTYTPLDQLPAAEWRSVVETNLTGTFNGMQTALRAMLPRNEGKIINVVGSEKHPHHQTAYATSKAALLTLTRLSAEEYAHTKLSIVALAPHFVMTPLWEQPALTDSAESSRTQWQTTLEKQASDLIEVGEWAVRLAGRETDGITGKVYEIKKGWFR
jgi:NAD(P)-dependent dehydrogenase (short-subunit alcohol dehydrogenase family)